MTELEVFGTKRRVLISSSWEEMTPGQIRFAFRTFDDCMSRGCSPLEFHVRMLYHLMGIHHRRRSADDRTGENVYRLCEQVLPFLLSEENGILAPAYKGTGNPLPTLYRFSLRPLDGPGPLCQDLTFMEFRLASAALGRFFKSKDVADLDECIACLYRPRGGRRNRAGRKVLPLNAIRIESEVKRVSRIPRWQKNLVMTWFSSCLARIQEDRITVNGDEIEMGRLFSGADAGNERSSERFTWTDLLVQIAREGSVGNIDRVDEEPLFSVFSIMWSNYKENKRYEKAAKTK